MGDERLVTVWLRSLGHVEAFLSREVSSGSRRGGKKWRIQLDGSCIFWKKIAAELIAPIRNRQKPSKI